MPEHTDEAFQYLDGFTDAYNGLRPARANERYREGHEAGKDAYMTQWQRESTPAPFCAPGDGDCEACQ